MDLLQLYGVESDSEDDAAPSADEGDAIQPREHVKDRSEPLWSVLQHPLLPVLPPPPDDLLSSSAISTAINAGSRIRSFPHVEGNYALHVYIPVTLPSYARNEVVPLVEKAMKFFPGLQLLEEGYPGLSLGDYGASEVRSGCTGGLRMSAEYHVSLSRTVPIRIHQIESITSMLRHKFSSQKRYIVEFGSWEVFTNDEQTRTFLSLEVTTAGNSEIQRQVLLVDEVFRLHNLPTFYESPRPHISLAWALGEVSSSMKTVAEELNKLSTHTKRTAAANTVLWSSQVRRIECKIGQRVYPVWASP